MNWKTSRPEGVMDTTQTSKMKEESSTLVRLDLTFSVKGTEQRINLSTIRKKKKKKNSPIRKFTVRQSLHTRTLETTFIVLFHPPLQYLAPFGRKRSSTKISFLVSLLSFLSLLLFLFSDTSPVPTFPGVSSDRVVQD